MLYFADTDWFLLSWRLLPLPIPHMVESACSSSAVFLCAVLCICKKTAIMHMSKRLQWVVEGQKLKETIPREI